MKVQFRSPLLFLSALLYLGPLAAQTDSTLATTHSVFFSTQQFAAQDSLSIPESSLRSFQNYLPHNHLGNSGLPFSDLSFNSHLDNPGFALRKNFYGPLFISPENLSLWRTHSPFTDLLYVTGSKKEQFFKMVFSYNLGKNWNLTANFLRIRSEGFYQRQKTNDNFAAISTNYTTRSHRYGLVSGLIFNSAQNQENGGIVADSMLETSTAAGQAIPLVNLTTARSTLSNTNFFVTQYLFLGKSSVDTSGLMVIKPESYFKINSSFKKDLFRYQDDAPAAAFYENIFVDSTRTDDSQDAITLANSLEWSRLDNGKHRGIRDLIGIRVEAGHQLVQVSQRNADTTFNNIFASASLFNTYTKHDLRWNIDGRYFLSGYNQGNYQAHFMATKLVADSLLSFSVSAAAKAYSADYSSSVWYGNNFQWRNDFALMKELTAAASVSIPKYRFSLTAGVSQYSDIFYYDNFAKARQYIGSVPVTFIDLKKDFTLLNWHLDNDVRWQQLPDSMVIRLPELVLQHSFYYENYVFKGHPMRMQIGVSLFYISSYFADAWMPATNQFYLQNEKKYGNYPFIDLFINAKVKAVRIFIKVDHLNEGWSGANYMQTPHYPINGRAYKLGVSWRFYD